MKFERATAAWLAKAEDDLLWTKANLAQSIFYGACFTAQQAAEKALKAYLLSKDQPARKIHDLGALVELCTRLDPAFESIRETALPLVDYYIQTRYPDIGDLIDYTEEKATDAYARAVQIVNFVKSKLS
jgi:HEPN domain-containing protein